MCPKRSLIEREPCLLLTLGSGGHNRGTLTRYQAEGLSGATLASLAIRAWSADPILAARRSTCG